MWAVKCVLLKPPRDPITPSLRSIHIMVNMYREREKCVINCLNIPVELASGHGQ